MGDIYYLSERNRIVEEHLHCIDTVIWQNWSLIQAARLERDDVYQQVAEREELVEAIAIALLNRKNLFILGAPGQAKSYAINQFRARITGARQFERLLSKQTDEEQLFGRVDLSSLLPGSVPETELRKDPTYNLLRSELKDVMTRLPKTPDDVESMAPVKHHTQQLEDYRRAAAALR